MRRKVILSVVIGCAVSAFADQRLEIHVAKGGSDNGLGTIERPYATLGRAVWAVGEELDRDTQSSDCDIIIHPGDYDVEKPIYMKPRQGGSGFWRVNIRPEQPGTVRLLGGRRVTDWREAGNGMYVADVPKGLDRAGVFENGKLAQLARTPDAGQWLITEGGAYADQVSTAIVKPEEIPEGFGPGCSIAVYAGTHQHGDPYDWFQTLLPVQSLDKEAGRIELTGKSWWNISPNNRYAYLGAKEFISTGGEFFYDREAGLLYYQPYRLPISSQHIRFCSNQHIIRLLGSGPDNPVRGVTISGLELTGTALPPATSESKGGNIGETEGLISMDQVEDIEIRNCRLIGAGSCGIAANHMSKSVTVENCLIRQVGFHGIDVHGYRCGEGPFHSADEAYVSRDWRIENNAIQQVGRYIRHGSGIWIYNSGGQLIANNLIEDSPRYAMNLLGQAYVYMVLPKAHGGQDGVIYGTPITWENHPDFVYSRNMKIINNEIRNVLWDASDAGAITAWGTGKNNVIRGNLIHHVRAFRKTAQLNGIYLDDAAKDFLVTENVVADIKGSEKIYPYAIKGIGNRVINNVAYDNETCSDFFSIKAGLANLPDARPGAKDEDVRNHVFERNICQTAPGGTRLCYRVWPFTEDMVRSARNNLFYHPGSDYRVSFAWTPEGRPIDEWKTPGGRKLGQGSVFGEDPQFVDPENVDFRVEKGSPAEKIGYKTVDVSRAGLRPDFPFMSEIMEK